MAAFFHVIYHFVRLQCRFKAYQFQFEVTVTVENKIQFMIDVIGLELYGWLNQTQMGISFEITF